jgi:hypothetical protein
VFNCALPIRPYPAKPAQDGRIYIELVNAAFLKAGGTAEQFRAGIQRAVDKRLDDAARIRDLCEIHP